jgi:adenine nucleotide transporter 17
MSDSSLLHAVAGAGAGCASLAITYPLYARMLRQQVQQHSQESKHSDESLLNSLRRLLTPAGLEPHFAGLPAALYAVGVQSAVYYYFFQVSWMLNGERTAVASR